MVFKKKSCCQHGGLLMYIHELIYIHDSLKYEIIDESENMSNWECSSLKILDNVTSIQKNIVSNIYIIKLINLIPQ